MRNILTTPPSLMETEVQELERDMREELPQCKKARVDISPDNQPAMLLGLVGHRLEPPPLPADWVAVPHMSGATVYLHKPTRVVTLSRPYHVSTSITIKKHSVNVQSVPCMEQWLFEGGNQLAQRWHTHARGKQGRLIKIGPDQLREYLSLRWDPSALQQTAESKTQLTGQSGEDGREGRKKPQQPQQQKKNPLVPDNLSKLVSVRVPVEYRKRVEQTGAKKPPAVWEVNVANKNSIVLLYEFCQSYLHTAPDFTFSQTKRPPYLCEVKVGEVRYGGGKGANKKIAKLAAAGEALESFLPGAFTEYLTTAGSSSANKTSHEEGLQLLCQVPLGDPQAPAMLAQTGFPTPWQTLRTALQWNQGFLSDKLTLDLLPLNRKDHTHSTEVPPSHQFECVLRCGEEGEEGEEVRVTCAGRKDGQVAAAQAMLKKLHPYITNWGSLLKLYSHPPPDRHLSTEVPSPPPSVAEGCGLLSGEDQQLLHSLRCSMSQLARQQRPAELPRSYRAGTTSPTHTDVQDHMASHHTSHIRMSQPTDKDTNS